MPFLEQRRRTRRDAAPERCLLLLSALLDLACRWWPPAWAALFLLGTTAGAALPGPPWPGAEVAGRAAALLPVLFALPRAPLRAATWCAVLLAAAAWGHGEAAARRHRPVADAPAALAPAVARSWRGAMAVRLTGYPAEAGGERWRAPAAVLAVGPDSGAEAPDRGQGIWLAAPGPVPAPGALLRVAATATPPARADVAGSFDLALFLAGRGLSWSVQADAPPSVGDGGAAARFGAAVGAAREAVAQQLDGLLPPRESRLARAVLLGWRTAESRTEAAGFTALGLAHLFAVSGLHVGILAGLVLLPGAALGWGRGARAALLAAATLLFVVLTGAPGSVVRAGTVVVLAALLPACGRRVKGLRLLGLVFWGVVVWDPRQTLDVGVRLSYLAAAGIVAANGLTGGFAAPGGPLVRAAAAGLGVSLAAQWATLPVVAAAFGQISPWSPVANLVAVPVFGVGVWLLAAATALAGALPWAAEALAAWGWLLVRALELGAARWAAAGGAALGLPPPGAVAVAAWLVLSAAGVAVLRSGWSIRRRAVVLGACLGAGLAVFGPLGRQLPPRGAPMAIQFAVGQGDCALVVFPDRWCALIDTGDAWRGGSGPFVRQVAPWLRRQGLGRLDAVVLTHGHRDHTGGAAAVGRAFGVGTWLGGGRAAETVETGPAPWLRPGPVVRVLHRWGEWSLEVLDPAAATAGDLHENDRSLAVVLRRSGSAAMVWTGDLEAKGEAALVAAGLVPAGAGVWKAGHHGSSTSGSPAFLAALRPQAVVVSCGLGNRYGHPSHGPYVVDGDTLPTVRTDLQGTVTVTWQDGTPLVRALRPRSGAGERHGSS